jgi:hypothetical protein
MFKTAICLGLTCALTLGVAALAQAQSSQSNANAPGKQKKQANQVPDSGLDQPGADAGDGPFQRVIENVPVTLRADGTLVAELDDSFMEALTVTVAADGTVTFAHYDNVASANRAMRLLPSRALPQIFPILEDKE